MQVLAEHGILGALAFGAILTLAVFNTARVKGRAGTETSLLERSDFQRAEALRLALLAYMIVIFFQSFHFDKLLWLLFAVSGVMNMVSERASSAVHFRWRGADLLTREVETQDRSVSGDERSPLTPNADAHPLDGTSARLKRR
jgi:hypothetical protein